jgi:hypothetical protein
MKFRCGRLLYLLLAASILVSRMPAQDTASFGPQVHGPSAAESSSAAPEPSNLGYPADSFSPDAVLVIPGIDNLSDLSGTGVVFGAGVSEGYGWTDKGQNLETTGSISGTVSVAQPFVGVFHSGRRESLLLEYSPTIDLFSSHEWNGNILQRGGLRGYFDLSRRWRFSFSSYSTYGLEYLRELDGIEIGAYPGWLTFLEPSKTVLVASVSTGLTFRRKPLQELSLIVNSSYSAIKNGPNYDAISARAQVSNFFGRDAKWYLYAQTNHHSNEPGCNRAGVGAGFDKYVTSSTRLALEAGPEYGEGTCTARWTGSFNGTIAQRVTPRTELYFSASRHLIEPYLLQSRWTDVFSGRLRQKTTRNTRVDFGAGYTQSSDIPEDMGAQAHYTGLLLFSEFHWLLSDSLTFVGSYRYAKRDLPSGVDNHYSWVVASLVWHPGSRSGHH